MRGAARHMPTVPKYLPLLALLASLGTGLMAGLFFAFSSFVMQGLSRLPVEQGMSAMQHINAAATNALFGLAFFGTAVACAVIIVATFTHASSSAAHALLLAASVLYLLGVIGVTVAFNVPLNNALASTAASQAAEYWPRYVDAWLGWNHVRTVLATAALACFGWGMYRLGTRPLPS